MGAGSRIATKDQQEQFYREMHPQSVTKECKLHWPKLVGKFHFLNTGEPYELLYCNKCEKYSIKV